MRNKNMMFLVLFAASVCGVIVAVHMAERTAPEGRRPVASGPSPFESKSSLPEAPSGASTVPARANVTGSAAMPLGPSAKAAPSHPSPQEPPLQAAQGSSQGDQPSNDELARIALSFVGTDPEAEAYWIEAINNPALSADERQNLIEDLNEDGLSDPKHPSLADLPMLLSRIALVEVLAGDSMDKVNADAFMEAHKDLVNLVNLANGGGEPVK